MKTVNLQWGISLNPFLTSRLKRFSLVLDLIENINLVPRKFFKKLEATNDIWEVRVQYGNNIFRLFGFFDGNDLVVLNHAFIKKTQKVPNKEIKIAEQRKKDYFSRRR